MINLLPVISRILSLFLAVTIVIDKFFPRVRLTVSDSLVYAGIIIYLLLVITEVALSVKSARSVKDTTRLSFNYLTKGRIFRKIILFIILGAMSVTAMFATNIEVVHALVLSITLMEVLGFVARVGANCYRVEIAEDTISVIEDQRKVAHYSRINDVEFRYEMFFLRMKDNSVYEVHLPSIKQHDQKRFVEAITAWLQGHNIPLTSEGTQKLHSFLKHGT